MILDVANPSLIDDGGTSITLIVIGILVLIFLIAIIIYLKKRG